MCKFGRRHHEEQFCQNVFNSYKWFKRCRKSISHLELWWPLWWSGTICEILVEGIMRNNFKFGPVIQEKMSVKNISFLELWRPSCSVEQNHLCNFGRGQYGEHSWFRRCHLKKRFRDNARWTKTRGFG